MYKGRVPSSKKLNMKIGDVYAYFECVKVSYCLR